MFNLEKSSKFYWSNYLKDIDIERTPEIFKPKNRIEAYGIQNNFLNEHKSVLGLTFCPLQIHHKPFHLFLGQ